MSSVTWVLESDVFPETHAPLRKVIRERGFRLIDWSDAWWSEGIPSSIPSSSVVFHGSLGNAARIANELDWSPGSFCPVNSFYCSAWYESARKWLVHHDWRVCSATELVVNAKTIAQQLNSTHTLFVRPDSPLKPFSGRVVEIDSLTLTKLDHGYYYEDGSLPVVIAPVQEIGSEWRFVIASGKVVTGSAYDPTHRKAIVTSLDTDAAKFAAEVASTISSPAKVYVLDVCESDQGLRLLELNPFGGADLYACDPYAVIDSISAIAATN